MAGFCLAFLLSLPLNAQERLIPLSRMEILSPAGASSRFDPSGLALHKGFWHVVSDKPEFPALYRLAEKDGKLQAEAALTPRSSWSWTTDFESLSRCWGRWMLADEATRSLIFLSDDGLAEVRPLDLSSVHEKTHSAPAFGTRGAGLEGAACDEKSGRIWAANERQFRMIYSLSKDSSTADDFFDVPAAGTAPRYEGRYDLWPDYADLFLEAGFLYALERNERSVAKIDPLKKSLIQRVRLDLDEKLFYDAPEPFGMAEGLYLTEKSIFILLDNNAAARRGRSGDFSSLLIEYPRPSGF